MQCPACGYPEMEEQNRDETLSYGGKSVVVQNLRGEFCPNCDEGIWDSESNRRLDEAQTELMDAVRKQTSADIRRIRKEVLKLTQEKLAERLGLGKLAFSRYERGKTQPLAAVVKLMKLIEKHPHLWDELGEMDVSHKTATTASGGMGRHKREAD
ncbi:MAG: type II TA system antitoxin MqsA family protein [Thermodesulfobacteriota bacterium]